MNALSPALRSRITVRDLGAWLRRTQPPAEVLDGAVAVGFLMAMAVERAEDAGQIGDRMPAAVVLALVLSGALLARRRAPLAVFLVSTMAMLLEARFVFVSAVTPNANLVTVYSLGLYATRARAWLGPVVIVTGNVAYFTSIGGFSAGAVLGPLLLWLLVWGYGYGTARRQEEREAARLVLRERVVADERAHIARELHDLVGHSLNVMLVQAGAARRMLDRDPKQTRNLLTGLENTGREAFEELDRVLGLLRPSVGIDARPADVQALHPGLADLTRLTERIGEAGIRITVHIDADGRDVPRSIDMSAYRIVQEALTNTVKHARAASADVRVVHRERLLDIEVCDDGHGAIDGYATGRGLLGIKERASMFGGRVEHGRGERGGFRLHAVLPIPR